VLAGAIKKITDRDVIPPPVVGDDMDLTAVLIVGTVFAGFPAVLFAGITAIRRQNIEKQHIELERERLEIERKKLHILELEHENHLLDKKIAGSE
jgi:hypothetical protein